MKPSTGANEAWSVSHKGWCVVMVALLASIALKFYPFVALLSSAFFAFWVFRQNPKNLAHRLLALLTLAAGILVYIAANKM
jgi:hypothetical protein